MVSVRLWIFAVMLLVFLVGGVYSYIWYSNSNHNSLYETNTVIWGPLIEVIPSAPTVGDSVIVYVKLVYSGLNEVYVNPFELRTKYSVNLTIVDLEGKSIYLSRSLGYKGADVDRRTVVIKPGGSIGIGYTEIVFIKSGFYAIKAHVDGPELTINEVVVELEVKPKVVEIGYENASRVDDWILTLRVKPENPTVRDNLTLEISLRYVGNDSFKMEAPVPLIKMVKMIHAKGIDSWSVAIPSHVSYIDVKPGFNQSFKFTVGPKASFPHEFSHGIYKVETYAIGYTFEGRPIDITVTLFIEIGES